MQPLATATFCGINLAAMAHVSEDCSDGTPIDQQQMWSYTTSHKRGLEDDSSDSDGSEEFMPQTPRLGMMDAGMGMPMDYFNIDMDNMSEVSPMTQVGELRQSQVNGRRLAKPRSRVRQIPMQSAPVQFNPFANMAAQEEQMLQQQQQQQQQTQPWAAGHRRITSCGIEANMTINFASMNGDFVDAPFLQRREDIDMDCS